jgi:hypothetical protein
MYRGYRGATDWQGSVQRIRYLRRKLQRQERLVRLSRSGDELRKRQLHLGYGLVGAKLQQLWHLWSRYHHAVQELYVWQHRVSHFVFHAGGLCGGRGVYQWNMRHLRFGTDSLWNRVREFEQG